MGTKISFCCRDEELKKDKKIYEKKANYEEIVLWFGRSRVGNLG